MNTKYVPAGVAGLVAVALCITRHITPIIIDAGQIPEAERLAFITRAANATGFLLTFVTLLGVAYLAGRRFDVRAEYGSLGLLTFLSASLGYLLGFLAFVFGTTTVAEEGILAMILLIGGPAIAIGIKLSVVVIAGASLAHFR